MTFAISWSRLDCHEKCALQSYWKNFAPKDQRVPFDNDSPHLIKGRLWHKWMEDACNGVNGAALPVEVSKFKPIIAGLRSSRGELLVEHRLTLTDKYQSCDWFSRQAYWRTIYDALKLLPNGNAFSLDWKTGKVRGESDQLKFSSAAAFLKWPKIKKIKSAYIWLEHPREPPTIQEYDRIELKTIMDEFEERVEMVKIAYEENTWEAQPSDFNCAYCPCSKAQCKYSRNE